MKIENTTKAKVTNTKRVEKNLVEPVPMREALINAVVHNDFTREIPPVFEIFSDRLELTSYGGLIPGQSRKEFFSCSSMPRNRELMRVFKDVGLVEQLGSGMSRILRYYDKSIFEISEHFIKVIFLFSLLDEGENIANGDNNGDNMCSHERLSRDVELVLEMLKKMPSITATEMSEQTGFSTRKISRIMRELRERGRIVRIGSTRKGYWKLKK